jgi:hypothetical protein
MVIAAPAPDPRCWAYRHAAISDVIEAVVAMIKERAGVAPRAAS